MSEEDRVSMPVRAGPLQGTSDPHILALAVKLFPDAFRRGDTRWENFSLLTRETVSRAYEAMTATALREQSAANLRPPKNLLEQAATKLQKREAQRMFAATASGYPIKVFSNDPGLQKLHNAVGGMIEIVPHFEVYEGLRCQAVCNEEGELIGIGPNLLMTRLWHAQLPAASSYRRLQLYGAVAVVLGGLSR